MIPRLCSEEMARQFRMETLSPNSAILDKTRELCTLILQSGEYRDNVSKIDAFFNDKAAQSAYRNF